MYGVPPTAARLLHDDALRPQTGIKNLWLAGDALLLFGYVEMWGGP